MLNHRLVWLYQKFLYEYKLVIGICLCLWYPTEGKKPPILDSSQRNGVISKEQNCQYIALAETIQLMDTLTK
jgi:hypothetical protein